MVAVNSSTSSFKMNGKPNGFTTAERWGLVAVTLAGLAVLLVWLQFGPVLVPTCRTMAMRALSPTTRVIATGTSRVERGIDPRSFKAPLVNVSSGGLSYLTMQPMIQRALARAPGARLVLIEFDIFLLKGKGLIKERLFELDVPMRYWPMPWMDRVWFVLENGGVLSAMPHIDVEYFAQSIRPNERPPAGANGFNPYPFFRDLSDEGSDELYGAAKYISMHRKELVGDLDGRNIAALLELLTWLDARDIQWRLITLPHLPGWVEGRPEEWEQSVEGAWQAIRARYPDIDQRSWDATSELGLGRPHFHDGLHLNRLGVEVFNRALDERINGWLTP